ncbi:hypothetical protein B9Z55_028772 [Caenorhabditis nigoni]|uniref:Uncharacterized protein n=1 Tax=Caenorhabditis nigoni TaxID=1611254 RepID=A0A2G5SAF0_9PELO|nr:hypothetical protein B9Z55_028772 [Caenorhabditis nigoni]
MFEPPRRRPAPTLAPSQAPQRHPASHQEQQQHPWRSGDRTEGGPVGSFLKSENRSRTSSFQRRPPLAEALRLYWNNDEIALRLEGHRQAE